MERETFQPKNGDFERSSLIVTVGDRIKKPDLVYTDAENNINAHYTTTIGVILLFTAHCSEPILHVEWTIQEFQSATVAGYTPTIHFGQFTDLQEADLTQNPIRFGWWKPETYTVKCQITTAKGLTSVTDIFTVTAPLVNDFNYLIGIVGVGQYHDLPFLRFARSHEEFQRDGILMNTIVAGTQHDPGILAGFQLANQQRFITDADHRSYKLSVNGVDVLDIGLTNTVCYQNINVPLPSDGLNVHFDPTDGPGIELNKKLFISVFIGDGVSPDPIIPERYRMNLMFKANTANSVWVPISVLAWAWEGTTQFEDGEWLPAQDAFVSVNGPFAPASFPTWNTNTSDRNWVPYEVNFI